MRKLSLALIVAIGSIAAPAYADSIDAIQINGAIGGQGGSHTVVIDGVTCKLKNSTFGQSQGCNYTLSGGIDAQGKGNVKATTSNQGCSATCQ
jgi:hypothetical protein